MPDDDPTDHLPPRRPRLLVFSYGCDPTRGSEEGAGWGLVNALAHFADCTVLVGPEGWGPLTEWKEANPDAPLDFVLVDDPTWARPLTRRHNRIGFFLAYLGWLPRARSEAQRLTEETLFDATFHATYSAYWLPAPATELDLPSVWGPVGGGMVSPFRLWRLLGAAGIVGEIIDLVAVRTFAMRPATRATWRHATRRIAQNEDTRRRLPADLRPATIVLSHAAFTMFDEPPGTGQEPDDRYVVWAGLLQSRKGPELAVRAVAACRHPVRLVVAGDGPQRRRMESLAARLGVTDRIDFRGMLPRPVTLDLMRGAAAVLFSGFREEGGLALSEAMFLGAPVVVLDHGGGGVIARMTTDPDRVALVPPTSPAETVERMAAALDDFWEQPRRVGGSMLDRDTHRRHLRDIVLEAIAAG